MVFLLNDIFLSTGSVVTWLFLDYGSRALVVSFCFIAMLPRQLRLVKPHSVIAACGWAVGMVLTTVIADRLLRQVLPTGGLFAYPVLEGQALLAIDTVLGIPLVAVSEELLSRGLFLAWAERRGWRSGPTIMLSAALFAAFHWSLGPASIIIAAVFGIIAMVSVLLTRSLWPAIGAHWLTDLILFSLPDWLAQ
ncbi:MAG: CPBP family intramembrane metalloprotease [Rhodospirillaceae bacterium]|nr:CPBP family intramembrane metalloprotease [Rhodospirillales bacterium]